jgi:acetyltransferase-like isoleucine patch superfamily enzyme
LTDNIFFDLRKIASIGRNVIIGRTVRIRYPELVEIGDDVIIDDFTYISTALRLEGRAHISSGCKLIGGRAAKITMGEFSTLAPNVVLAAGSDDYLGGIATPMVPIAFKGAVEIGEIRIGRHCIVGANSTVLPNVCLHDGAAVGAQSLVKKNIAAWELHAGVPARLIRSRNAERIQHLERRFLETRDDG